MVVDVVVVVADAATSGLVGPCRPRERAHAYAYVRVCVTSSFSAAAFVAEKGPARRATLASI